MRKVTIALIALLTFVAGLGLHYALPRVSTVQVLGVEVKREDTDQRTRDVYMIQAQLIDGGAVRVFRNDDAWFYLKFDSANLQARATGLSRDEAVEAVAIRHYGWRIPVLSMFPNAISAWPVELGYRHIPLFNMAVILTLLTGGFFAWRTVKRARARVEAALARRSEERAREAASRTVPPVSDAGHEDWLLRDQPTSNRPDDPGRGA
ncbi:DUF1523 family protein [Nioella nitratireducens]|uniref:DUF1523 family protein n=1 Tax=Nioella nitratireducens TaxID=1287720 RepID=UPI0008FD0E58|nr:DUF1523 family protein [Nioella nitratireducens]